MSPIRRSTSNSGGIVHDPVSIATPNSLGSMRGVLSVMPPPVMCAAPVQQARRHQRANRLQVAAMHLQQLVAHRRPHCRQHRFRTVPGHFEQQLARQRIAVGVQPVRGQPEQHVARANTLRP